MRKLIWLIASNLLALLVGGCGVRLETIDRVELSLAEVLLARSGRDAPVAEPKPSELSSNSPQWQTFKGRRANR